MNLASPQARQYVLDAYRPLIGLKLVGVRDPEDCVGGEWPSLLLADDQGRQHVVEVGCDPEGNGPGCLFYDVPGSKPGDAFVIADDLKVTDVQVVPDEYEDWIWWPTLTLVGSEQTLTITVSQDPEGNGPGHLHGIPA